MVKIFIGNLSQHTEKEEIEALFTPYGTVTECAKYKNYAFVHMDDRKSATKAIRELHLFKMNGRPINVEPSRGKNQGPVKLHVANVEKGFEQELRDLFEEYGTVTECSIVKNFAFVHMSNSDEAMDALQGLDNSEFQGKRIHVQVSKSRPRGEEEEYPPPPSFYPPYYPGDYMEQPYGGHMSTYPPPPPPPPPPPRRSAYSEAGYGERDPYQVVDYYQKYRANVYGGAGHDERRAGSIPPPPPPPSGMVRDHPRMDPYERAPNYMARDRSPIRRPPPGPAPSAGNGYSYERSRLSPGSRAPLYPRPRESFTDRVPPPPPPPPRYTGY